MEIRNPHFAIRNQKRCDMEILWQDIRYGLRMLVTKPGFTFIAVFTLALGIGANTAIFSVVNAVLLRLLPYENADRIVRIDESHTGLSSNGNVTYANFIDLYESLNHAESALPNLAASRSWSFNLTEGSEPERVTGAQVSYQLFDVLKVTPIHGRTFTDAEDQPDGESVIIISHKLWQRRFAADPDIIGKNIRVNDVSRTVIGVMPPDFSYPQNSEVWTPLIAKGALQNNRRSHLLTVIGRLKDTATIDQANTEVAAVASRISEQYAGVDPDLSIGATGLQERIVAPIRLPLLVLFFAVGFVLLIACANVANLLLARATTREKEMAIRAALGAGRWRLIRQTLTESLLLAVAGGAAGLLLTIWSLDLIKTFQTVNIPRLNEVSLDGRVLLFALIMSLLTGVLFGLAPALRISKFNLGESLKEGGRTSGGTARNRLRHILVVAEIAMSFVLLIGAGLLINSFMRLSQINPGFDANNLLTMNVFLSPSRYAQGAQQSNVIARILENIRTVPGVRFASVVNVLPIQNAVATTFEIENHPSPNGEEWDANIQVIDPDYFQTMSIPLLKGRVFTQQDGAGAPQTMIINETLARQYFSDEEPIGKRITMKDWGPPLTGEVVGVVTDVRANGLEQNTRPMIYWNHPQFPQIFNNLMIRTEGDSMQVVAAVKQQIWSVDKEQTISSIRTMDQVLANSVAQRQFYMLLLAIFAGVALLLAAIGIYGVMSYTVTQRTHEIGIRRALGAQQYDVLKIVVGQAMILAATGISLGLLAAYALTHLMSSLLYGVTATDTLTFAIVATILTAVALVACLLPANRATKVDPMIALRYE
jgi:putative ABC transport system permease protein